jgi:outer membrane protein assembly factor BamB
LIKVISPNGAEEWLEGSTHELAWRSSDVAKIDIEVASGGKPLGHVALAVDTTSGRYPWKIPVGLISNFGVAASDAMRVRISSSEDPSVYDENDDAFTVRCPRIQFQAGAASSSVTGTLDADSTRFRYVLDAAAGQTVEIHISPAQVGIDVWGAEDGSTWELPAAGKSDLIIPSLPRSQDYFITLISAAGTEAIDYTLEVAVR